MEFFFSSEVDKTALFQMHEVGEAVRISLTDAVAKSTLSELDVRVRYIPIIMKAENLARFPARSRLERKNRIFNCCPQLDIQIFLTGTRSERVAVFVNGLRECGPALAKLGATSEQVAEFDRILDHSLASLTSG
ncbi:MAG: hypothetical protein B7Z10_11675 [Rhodobacterales bacterium 32-66-7]|nr:MAG: hypothetical protein B7Z31_07035 [Rhodobacterales bacterium 12-65-15]OYX23229.1 MAG: hypothetical protein B7Z10_11675 [Rhodobacterales bacterium 32-66-7]